MNFIGRETELRTLMDAFKKVAAQSDGCYPAPQTVIVIADSGLGKSRLVQQLYIELTNHPDWDPRDVNYWPDAFQSETENLRVEPDMHGHRANGMPRFLWLGARFSDPNGRNAVDQGVLPAIKSSLRRHRDICVSLRDRLAAAKAHAVQGVQEVLPDLLTDAASSIIPGAGWLLKAMKRAAEFVSERRIGPQSHDDIEVEQQRSEVEGALEEFAELFGGKPIPTVLWLDDAQWIDSQTLELFKELRERALKLRWPLLVVMTHWESDWRRLTRGQSPLTLREFEGQPDITTVSLCQPSNSELKEMVVQRFPGIAESNLDLLVEKAHGNYLQMHENLTELGSKTVWFQERDFSKDLTQEACRRIESFETDRKRRVRQRFNSFEESIQQILGWSSSLGVRFLGEVIERFAARRLRVADSSALLSSCVDPKCVLNETTPNTREFRDRAFYEVAAEYREIFQRGDDQELGIVLGQILAKWINNSFDESGCIVWQDEEDAEDADESNAASEIESEHGRVSGVMSMEATERRDVLGMAMQQLRVSGQPDWSKPEHRAAIRAVCVAILCDSLDLLWGWVRKHGESDIFKSTLWDQMPNDVIGYEVRAWICDNLVTVRALGPALVVAKSTLEIARALDAEESTPRSRRDISISLDNIAGIEKDRGELDLALEKYNESLAIRRALDAEESTPRSREAVIWIVLSVAEVSVAARAWESALASYLLVVELLGRFGSAEPFEKLVGFVARMGIAECKSAISQHASALEVLDSIRSLAEEMESVGESDRETLDFCALYWELLANAAEACGATGYEDAGKRATALRLRLNE